MRVFWFALTLLATVSFLFYFVQAQEENEEKVEPEDLPAGVQETVLKISQGTAIRGLAREKEGEATVYEVELDVNGRTRDVIISESGEVLIVEEEVPFATLPAAVRTTLETESLNGEISLVESIAEGGKLTAYEAHLKVAGKEKEVKVDPEGNLLPDKP